MKYVLYALGLVPVSSYGPPGQVRNVKRGSNGTILITSSVAGIFRYDGKSFTKLTSKIGLRRFWDVLEDRPGSYGLRY
jgi:NAD(P)-dependent dehydrogenase (short-subunit alcohol dehydrogenase family)